MFSLTSLKSSVFGFFQRVYKSIHAGGAFSFHLLRNVSVYVQSESGCMVSKVFLHCFDIVSGSDSGDSIRVSKIMKASIREADGGGKFLEVFINRVFTVILSERVSKHQIQRIVPCRTGFESVLYLLKLAVP